MLEKLTKFLEDKFMPVAVKIANQKHLQAVRDGIILTIPLIIVGSIFLILAAFPLPIVGDFLTNNPVGQKIRTYLLYPVNVTFGLMSIIACLGIAYRLSEKYKVDPLGGAAIALVTFMLVTPFKISIDGGQMIDGIPLMYMGSLGLFVAIIMSILSIEIYRIIIQKNIIIKMPDSVPPAVSRSFAALIPATIAITVAWIIKIIFENVSFGNIHELIKTILTIPLTKVGTSFFGVIVITLLIHLLWATGIHGSAIILGITAPVLNLLLDQNRLAYQAHQAIPNVVTAQFFDIFMGMGGAGTTFSLAFMLAFISRSKQLKEIGKLSLGPSFFNINEPILFGVPMIMNPIMLIPFLLSPLVVVTITYFSMKVGLVGRPAGIAIPWTTPPILGGFLVTGGKISGVIIQIINFIITFLIYYPFFRLWDNQKLSEEKI